VLRIVPYSALHFSAYESYRQSLARMFARHAGVAEEAYHVVPAVDLLAGSAAGGGAGGGRAPPPLPLWRVAWSACENEDMCARACGPI